LLLVVVGCQVGGVGSYDYLGEEFDDEMQVYSGLGSDLVCYSCGDTRGDGFARVMCWLFLVVHFGLSGWGMGMIDRLVGCMPVVFVIFLPIFAGVVFCPLMGRRGWNLWCVVGRFISILCVMTACSLRWCGLVDACFDIVIILKARLVACSALFCCSVGLEVPVGKVMVECLVLDKICL